MLWAPKLFRFPAGMLTSGPNRVRKRTHNLTMKKLITKALGTLLLLGGATDVIQAATCRAPQPTICTRSCWVARDTACSGNIAALTRAIIHHTENANDFNVTSIEGSKSRMRLTQNYHMDTL